MTIWRLRLPNIMIICALSPMVRMRAIMKHLSTIQSGMSIRQRSHTTDKIIMSFHLRLTLRVLIQLLLIQLLIPQLLPQSIMQWFLIVLRLSITKP